MKKIMKIALIVFMSVFMFYGSATAVTYTFEDQTDSWPGYIAFGTDYIGSPDIQSMEITINDSTGYLETVMLNIERRRVFDSLFINTGGDGLPYEAWDWYVKDVSLSDSGATLYSVASEYTYEIVSPHYPYRPDHPVGFLSGITEDQTGLLISVLGTDTTLTYTFGPGILMNEGFVIGYTPDCANDVIITPEPGLLLLLGIGLLGVGYLRRKK